MNRRAMLSGISLVGAALAPAVQAPPVQAKVKPPAKVKHGDASDLAMQFVATLNHHDMKAFAALFADDYRNYQVSAAAPPPSDKTPKQATVDFFTARLTGLPDLSVSIETVLVSVDRFAASFVYTGTHKGPLFGVAPTGKSLRFTSCDIFAVREGQLSEHWGMGDIAGVMAQLKA